MQIHELNAFSGTPGAGDYLVIDDGEETFKVPSTSTGIQTAATQAEVDAGTSTAKRVLTPKVLHDAVVSVAKTIADTWVDITTPKVNLDTTAASGTTDGDLYAAIVALGWASDVVV